MALTALLTTFFIQGILPDSTAPDQMRCTFRESETAPVLTVRVQPLTTRHPSGVHQVKMWLSEDQTIGAVAPAPKRAKRTVVVKGVTQGKVIHFIALSEDGAAYMHSAPKADTSKVTTRVGSCQGHAKLLQRWLAG